MNWNSAAQFITNMNAGAGYLGQTNWVLPPMDTNCDASYDCASTSDPLGQLFYDQLGLRPGTPVVAAPNIAVGPVRHIQPYLYWACEAPMIQDACETDGPARGFEWSFSFGNGFQGTDILANDLYVDTTRYRHDDRTQHRDRGGPPLCRRWRLDHTGSSGESHR